MNHDLGHLFNFRIVSLSRYNDNSTRVRLIKEIYDLLDVTVGLHRIVNDLASKK